MNRESNLEGQVASSCQAVRACSLALFFTIVVVCSSSCRRHAEPDTAANPPPGATSAASEKPLPARQQETAPATEASSSVTERGTITKIATAASDEHLAAMHWDIDPANDGWDTEVFAERVNKQLDLLGQYVVGLQPTSVSEAGGSTTSQDASPPLPARDRFLGKSFTCSAFRPTTLETLYSDGMLMVRGVRFVPADNRFEGAEGLTQAIREMLANLKGAADLHYKFKLFRLEPKKETVSTTLYFELSGQTNQGSIQQNATWACRWSKGGKGELPKLLAIDVREYSEAELQNRDRALYSECSESVFRNVPAYDQQLRLGIDYWRSRLEAFMKVYYDGHHGLAVGDVNGDGLDDIYLCEPGGLPNRLLIQKPSGELEDVSANSGVNFLDYTRSVLLVDLDNDGDQDLVSPISGALHVFANDGTGRFEKRATLPVDGQTAYSLAAADYDEDGDVDFYACFYHGHGEDEKNRLPAPFPYHDARTGGPNRLFRNDGEWQFQDVTSEVGLEHNNDRWSFAAVWEDLDNDGDLDLYVVNDFGMNNLYRQENGRFKDVAEAAGAEDMNFGMSASSGDFDRDGWMDLYVSNMFSSAGGRITIQPKFKTGGSEQLKKAYQQMARGNTLLHNLGNGTFQDVSVDAGVTMGRWAWGSLFADVNNDGWEDILVANGFVTGKMKDDL
jgi:hypothetical protein